MSDLVINNLHVRINEKPIIKGLNLTIPQGEVHAIMGPNGTGKSTLANTIMGHPSYEVTEGEIFSRERIFLNYPLKNDHIWGCFWLFNTRFPSRV
jgi:Fe-S cluster assembly ATP-binding protein